MNEIIKTNRQYEDNLRESEAQLKRLKEQHEEKEIKLMSLEKEVSELKCCPSASITVDDAWEQIKNRADMYDEVVKERNNLKDQLCKMVGVEELLKKLKKRADDADVMEVEIEKLRRELQRYGAAGDDAPKNRSKSACRQCHDYGEY